ncbi:hypothetical protein T492DRAFT_962217 [Pavlovales sp. CCMP2436]|nr:hypothetical protein T492DRAFT_962217 [Pavlovales sp. CCMP2436]
MRVVIALFALIAGVADASSCGIFSYHSEVESSDTLMMHWNSTSTSAHAVVHIVVTPSAGRGVAPQKYVLTKCTSAADKAEVQAEYSDAVVITVPVKGLTAIDTVQIALLDTLDKYTLLRAYPQPLLISSTVVRTWILNPDHLVESHVAPDGYGGFGTDFAAQANVSNVDVHLSSIFEYGASGETAYTAAGVRDKMVLINEIDEGTPLGRAEWIKVVGLLTGKEAEAQVQFSQIKAKYETAKSFVAQATSQPKVWYNGFYYDIWYPAKSGQYTYQYLVDAYTQYVLPSNEVFPVGGMKWARGLELAGKAQFWLSNSQSWASLSSAAAASSGVPLVDFSALSNLAPFGCENVWDNDLSSETVVGLDYPRNDFFESGVINPDQILKEIIMIVHPELSAIGSHKYFRHVPSGTLKRNCPFDASSSPATTTTTATTTKSTTASKDTGATAKAVGLTGLNLGLTVAVAILGSSLIALALATSIIFQRRMRAARVMTKFSENSALGA